MTASRRLGFNKFHNFLAAFAFTTVGILLQFSLGCIETASNAASSGASIAVRFSNIFGLTANSRSQGSVAIDGKPQLYSSTWMLLGNFVRSGKRRSGTTMLMSMTGLKLRQD